MGVSGGQVIFLPVVTSRPRLPPLCGLDMPKCSTSSPLLLIFLWLIPCLTQHPTAKVTGKCSLDWHSLFTDSSDLLRPFLGVERASLGIIGRIAVTLASVSQMPIVPVSVTTKNVCTHEQMSPGGKNYLPLNVSILKREGGICDVQLVAGA